MKLSQGTTTSPGLQPRLGAAPEPARNCRRLRSPESLIALLLMFALLGGCASDGGTAFARYTLPMSQFQPPEQYPGAEVETVVVEPIRMASYLNSEGVVMQLSDIEVQQARNHLWAESLSRQLERSLRQQLSEALPEARVVIDTLSGGDEAFRVRIDLDRFQGRYDGNAVISGNWQVRNSEGLVVSRQSFSIEKALETDGYPALIRSLAQAWGELTERLARDLARLPVEA